MPLTSIFLNCGNYEHDFRSPNEEQLAKIARKLDVPVEALSDYEVTSAREALEALFRRLRQS